MTNNTKKTITSTSGYTKNIVIYQPILEKKYVHRKRLKKISIFKKKKRI